MCQKLEIPVKYYPRLPDEMKATVANFDIGRLNGHSYLLRGKGDWLRAFLSAEYVAYNNAEIAQTAESLLRNGAFDVKSFLLEETHMFLKIISEDIVDRGAGLKAGIMAQDPDPIGNGFIASLAHPGGNITGLSNVNRELSGKRLELLREIVPRLSRLAVFGTTAFPGNAQGLKEVEAAAAAFGVKLQYLDCLGSEDIDIAFRAASKEQAGAILVLPGPIFNSHQTKIADLAVKNRLPATYNSPEYVEGGGLMWVLAVASFSSILRGD